MHDIFTLCIYELQLFKSSVEIISFDLSTCAMTSIAEYKENNEFSY